MAHILATVEAPFRRTYRLFDFGDSRGPEIHVYQFGRPIAEMTFSSSAAAIKKMANIRSEADKAVRMAAAITEFRCRDQAERAAFEEFSEDSSDYWPLGYISPYSRRSRQNRQINPDYAS
ncbi:MAG: hypothetical protein ACRD34_11675 [Bryobacteraceae bacterium]